MFNCDESGFVLGGGRMERVIGRKGERVVTSVGNSDKRQITVLANMSSDGTYLPPMMVFPGVRLSPEVAEGAPEGTYIGRSPSGWMNSEVFLLLYCELFHSLHQTEGGYSPNPAPGRRPQEPSFSRGGRAVPGKQDYSILFSSTCLTRAPTV